MYSNDRRYTKEHEWVKADGDVYLIGITDFAQKELGDIVFVEPPEVGSTYGEGDVLGTIESVKAVSEIFAPLAGEVVEINDALESAPETVNQAAHEAGWYCKMKLDDPSAVDHLMDADAYQALIEG